VNHCAVELGRRPDPVGLRGRVHRPCRSPSVGIQTERKAAQVTLTSARTLTTSSATYA
jgi:hypothetical protein